MQEWNSFRRVEAAFNHDIPDRVPKYEGSIEIKEFNPFIDGQTAPLALLFFPPQLLNIFHKASPIVSILRKAIKHPRLFHPIASVLPRIVSNLHRQFNYDIFTYPSGVPMIYTDQIFRDFYTEDKNKVIRHRDGRVVWKVSLEGAHARYGFIQSPTEWDKYLQFDPDHPANYITTDTGVKACKKLDIVPQFIVWGAVAFEELCSIFGFEKLFNLLITDKNFVRSAVKEMNDYALAVAEGILQRGGKYIYFTGDLGYTGRSLISPRMFRDFFKPSMKK